MPTQFVNEIFTQPAAPTDLLAHYEHQAPSNLIKPDHDAVVLLTGMGASFHAASIAVYQLQRKKVFAQALEAVELLNYLSIATSKSHTLVYISQSGASGEVIPIFDNLPAGVQKIGITNNLNSPLAQRSNVSLPLCAGDEFTVASKTYVNCLALGALLSGVESQVLYNVRNRMSQILDTAAQIRSFWLDVFGSINCLYLLGHGPHGTAR